MNFHLHDMGYNIHCFYDYFDNVWVPRVGVVSNHHVLRSHVLSVHILHSKSAFAYSWKRGR